MATYGSGSGRWGRTNDGIFGGTPDDTNGIYGLDGDHYLANMTTPNYGGSSLEIKTHVRAQNFSAGNNTEFLVKLLTNGGDVDGEDQFTTGDAWQNFTFTLPLVKTDTDLQFMRVRVEPLDASFDTRISEIEVEVVLTSSSSSSCSSSSSSFSSCSSSSSSCDSAFSSSSSSSSFSSSSSSSCDSAFSSSSSSCSSCSSSSSSESFQFFQSIWIYPQVPDDLNGGFTFGAGSNPGNINNGIVGPGASPDDTNGIGGNGPDDFYDCELTNNPIFVGQCLFIRSRWRLKADAGTGDVDVNLRIGGSPITSETSIFPTTSWVTYTATHDVQFNYTQCQALEGFIGFNDVANADRLSELEVEIVLGGSSSSSSSCSSSSSSTST